MQSKAATVKEYLAELSPERREAIEAVRRVILKNLGKGYEEGMSYGMIGYYVPHALYPAGYHCNPKLPLPFAGLASQKQYMSVYLMPVYGPDGDEARFREAWAKTGKKLDMGKCCIRFKRVEDVALDVIGEAIRRMPVKKWIAHYEAVMLSGNRAAAKRAGARKVGAKKVGSVKAGAAGTSGRKAAKATPSARAGAGRRKRASVRAGRSNRT